MKVESILGTSNTFQVQASGIGQGGREVRPLELGQQENVKLPGEKPVTEDVLNKAVDKLNKGFVGFDRRFEVSVHEKTNTIMVKVIDVTNDQVIREFPPEKILDMVANMLEMAGIIVDTWV